MPEIDHKLRIRVAEFLADYSHTIDDDNLENWPNFFLDDAVYQITTRENEESGLPIGIMYCEGRGMLEDRIRALRTANIFEPHTYCHLLGVSSFENITGNLLAVRTNFSVVRTKQDGTSDIFAVGKYVDEIIFTTDDLKFYSRRVILESRRIDILLVIPL